MSSMVNATQLPTLIEKEDVAFLLFPHDNVLDDVEERLKRETGIFRALRLGNNQHYKVKIIFRDSVGLKVVHTTIWAITEQKVVLKNGITIPVHRIHSIQYC